MLLSRFPRVSLAHLPTPLEHLPRLSQHLGGPQIYVKRDDCTGLATGGNKTRKLEFSVAAALESGADTVVTVGAVQSNHVRQTAAAASKLGLQCEVLLEHRIAEPSDDYRHSGNVLLDHLFGARVREYPAGTDFDEALEHVANDVNSNGGRAFIIPGGASDCTGALGYVNCALELLGQANAQQLEIDHIVTPTGSAGTQGGLIVGLRATHSGIPLLGIGVGAPREQQEQKVFERACVTADFIGAPGVVGRDDVVANCDYVGDGYGLPTPAMNEAVLLLARLEGLLVDPVYTGKALAGLIDLVRRNHFNDSDNIVFLHTGGSAALFAYKNQLNFD